MKRGQPAGNKNILPLFTPTPACNAPTHMKLLQALRKGTTLVPRKPTKWMKTPHHHFSTLWLRGRNSPGRMVARVASQEKEAPTPLYLPATKPISNPDASPASSPQPQKEKGSTSPIATTPCSSPWLAQLLRVAECNKPALPHGVGGPQVSLQGREDGSSRPW